MPARVTHSDDYYSAAIGKSKILIESLNKNYTSSQIIGTLDLCLLSALKAIDECSHFLENALLEILTSFAKPSRRRVSSLSKESLYANILIFLTLDDYDERKKQLQVIKFDRDVQRKIIHDFLKLVEQYEDNYSIKYDVAKSRKLYAIEQAVAARHSDILLSVREANRWFELATGFKQAIMEKYMRLTVNSSVSFHNKWKHIPLDDLFQNFLVALSRAIDKYDSDKGTLTSYITVWHHDAQRIKSHHTESHVSLDTISENPDYVVEDTDDSEEKLIRLLAKYADPEGIARISLCIPEILTPEEIAYQLQYDINRDTLHDR